MVGYRAGRFAVLRLVGNPRGNDAEEWARMDVLLWNLPSDPLDRRSHHATNASWGHLEGGDSDSAS